MVSPGLKCGNHFILEITYSLLPFSDCIINAGIQSINLVFTCNAYFLYFFFLPSMSIQFCMCTNNKFPKAEAL